MKRIVFFAVLLLVIQEAYAQNNFRSRQTGSWSDSNTWEEETSPGVWTNTVNVPDFNDGVITLMSGLEVSVPNGVSVTADQIEFENIIDSGVTGSLNINSGGTFILNNGSGNDIRLLNDFTTLASLVVSGDFQVQQGATIVEDDYDNLGIGSFSVSGETFKVLSGGEYIHNYTSGGGAIPAIDWQVGSTCTILGASTVAPLNMESSSFHHLTWNGTSQSGTIDLNLQDLNVSGTFTVVSTNGNLLRLGSSSPSAIDIGLDFIISGNSRLQFATTQSSTINVGRDMQISSTNIVGSAISATANSSSTINVTGDFIKSEASTFSLGPGTSSVSTLNIGGDFTFTGGLISRSTSNFSTIRFTGTGIHNYTSSIAFPSTQIINIELENSSQLVFNGDSFLRTDGSFTSGISSSITFNHSSASGAFQNSTTDGNFRVAGTKTFGSSNTFIFGSNVVSIGNGLPASGYNLTINKSSGSINLSNDITISSGNILTLQSGNLSIGVNTLTLNGTVSSTGGGLSGGANSNLTISGTGAFGTLTFAGTNQLNNFTLNRTSSGSVTLGGDLNVLGAFTQTAGDLVLNGNTFTLSGDYSRTGGSLIFDGAADFVINGAGALPASLAASGALQTLTLDRASASLGISASFAVTNLNLFSGEINNSGTITMADGGSLTRYETGSLTNALAAAGTYDITYDIASAISSGPELSTSSTAVNNFTKLGSGTLTLAGNTTINGDLTLSNGSLDAGNTSLGINGNIVSNAPSVLSNATLVFGGNTSTSGSTALSFGNIQVDGIFTPASALIISGNLVNNGTLNSSSGTVTFSGTTAISGTNPVAFNNVTISGSLTASATQSLSVAGNFVNNGTFNANTGTIVFAGTTSISGSNNPTFHNIQISGTLNSPATLNVSGSWTNNGTFVAGTNTVHFNGTGTRTVSGSSTTAFHDLNVTGGLLNVNGTVSIADVLTLGGSTTFDADGAGAGITTLLSTSTLDARVAAIPSGSSVSGNITVQRFLPYGSTQARMYRYLGVPVSGATVADWQDDFAISGTFTGASTGTGITSYPSMFYFDPATGYVAYPTTSNTESLSVGRGYSPYIRTTSPITIDVTGTLVQGNQSVAVQTGGFDSGYNLIANPYASPIDWDLVNKTGLDDAIYIKDNSEIGSGGQGVYVSYVNGVSTIGGFDGTIASGQAFWVRSASASSINFEENDKTSTAQFYSTPTPVQDLLRIHAKGNGKIDAIVIRFAEGASNGDDAAWDAKKFNNDFINLSSITEGQKYAINAVAPLSCDQSFALAIENFKEGSYTLTFSEWETFQNPVNATLYDSFTGTSVDVKANREYTFDVLASDSLSFGQERFTLTLEREAVNTNLAVSSPKNSLCVGEAAEVVLANTQSDVQYQLLVGEKAISDWQLSQGGTLTFTVPADSLGQEATVQAVAQRSGCTEVFALENTLAITYPEAPQIIETLGTTVCLGADASVSVNATGASAYRWYASAEGDDLIEETTTNSLEIIALMGAETLYVSALNAAGCESSRTPVGVQIEEVIAPQSVSNTAISCANESLTLLVQAEGAVGYQWYTQSDTPSAFATTTEGSLLIEQVVSNTNYYVASINANGCESARTEIAVSISNAPQVVGLANQEICVGAETEIAFEAVSGANLYRLYASETATVPLQESASPAFALTPEANATYYISAVNSNGCEGSRSATTITLVEEASIEAVVPTELCVGASASISLNTNATQVLWYTDAALTQEANFSGSTLELAEVNESVSYYAVPLNALGCVGMAQEVQIIASQPNSATVEAITTCDLASLTLYAAGASANQVYVWFKNGQEFTRTALGKLDITNHVLDNQWTVAIASEQGCVSEFTALSISYSPIEQAQVAANVSVCIGESVEITATGGSESALYQWYTSLDAETAIATGASFVSPVLEGNTSYFVSLTNALGCEGTRQEVQVEVINPSPAIITTEGNVLTSNYSEGNQWYLDGVLLEGETNQQLEATESGTYRLVVNVQGCTVSAEQVLSVLGLGKGASIFSRVYPNPVVDRLFIRSNQGTITAVKVFTSTGAEISNLELIPSGGNYEMDMSSLRKGAYIIQITNENQIDTWRIIKQ